MANPSDKPERAKLAPYRSDGKTGTTRRGRPSCGKLGALTWLGDLDSNQD